MLLSSCSDYRYLSIEYITVSALCACVNPGRIWFMKARTTPFWSLDFCSSVSRFYFYVIFLILNKKSMLMRSPCSLCLCESSPPPINFCIREPIFIKLGMYIMAPETISTANLMNSSHQSVYLHVYPSYHS
jgi:hypothetical protein